jgi:hypothetical protein
MGREVRIGSAPRTLCTLTALVLEARTQTMAQQEVHGRELLAVHVGHVQRTQRMVLGDRMFICLCEPNCEIEPVM